MNSYKYTIEGLDCANCAMKVENAIKAMDGIESAALNFAAKTLTVKSDIESDELIRSIQKTIERIEDGVAVFDFRHSHKEHGSHHEHHHNDDCCGCHEHKLDFSDKANVHKYTIEGLDCANCAMKVENAIKAMEGVESAVLNFAAKTLTVQSDIKSDKLINALEKTIAKVEDGVVIKDCQNSTKKKDVKKKTLNKDKMALVETISAVILLMIGIGLSFVNIPQWISMMIMGISSVAAGYRVIIKGFRSIIKFNLNENVLMSVAVIAALCIGEFFEAAAVTILFSIGEILENKAVNTSRRDIEKLSQIRPDTARIITHEGTETVDAEDVAPDTEILVEPYERIPIDGVIYEGSSSIDTSALTGESIPRSVSQGNAVMSGMMNLDGVLKIRTTKRCYDSAAARILRMVEESAAQKGKAENFITRFAKVYTPIVFICAVILCVLPPLLNIGDFFDWLNRALVFLVASCPCALVISIPLGFYSGIGACSKIGVLIKGGKYIEALSKAQNIAFDKTGTLTSGELRVIKIAAKDGYSENDIIKIAAAAEEHSTHPVALAVKKRADGLEIPLLQNNKEKAGCGISAVLDGKEILCGNKRLFSDENLQDGVVYLSVDGKVAGEIYIEDTVRSDTPKIIKKLSEMNFKHIIMLTGDSEENAKKIALSCGLSEYRASLLPQDKKIEVEKLQKKGKTLFVGDGINDAPVLAKADCGFAMGLGSEAAIESADAVLVNGTLSQLPVAVELSRRTMRTVYFNIIFALAIKAIILILAVLGIAPMWIAVFADTGVSVITVLNSSRILHISKSV